MFRQSGLDGVIRHGRGIRSGPRRNDLCSGPVCPELELFGGRRAEGVAGGEHDFLSLPAPAVSEFSGGCGLSASVHADHQDHGQPFRGRLQKTAVFFQHLCEVVLCHFEDLIGSGKQSALIAVPHIVDNGGGRSRTEIGFDQRVFQRPERGIVPPFHFFEETGHASSDCRCGLLQPLLERLKQRNHGFFSSRAVVWCRAAERPSPR